MAAAHGAGHGADRKLDAVSASRPTDFGTHVREVQAQLADSAQRAGLGRDPYARVVEAQSAALGVLPDFIEAIDRTRQPWTQDERYAAIKDAVSQMDRRMLARWVQFNWAGMAVMALVVLSIASAAFGAGWWYRGNVPVLAGIRAGIDRCDDHADGSRICWIPIYERPPAERGR